MKNYIFPDYNNSLLNLMASLRKYYGLDHNYQTLDVVDKELAKNYKTVIILLLDGMGSFIMDKHKSFIPFMMEHKVADYYSTFPCTTAAATTSLINTLAPIESGWLGWHQYFKQIDRDTVMFTGVGYYDEIEYQPNPSYTYVPYIHFRQTLIEKGVDAEYILPKWYKEAPAKNINDFFNKIRRFANKPSDKLKYMYAYWEEPDHCLHDNGTESKNVSMLLKDLDKRVKKLASKLPEDTLLIVTADHGHHDIKNLYLSEHPDLIDTLVRLPSIEPRNSTFFVKKGQEKTFEELFKKYYGDYFLLLTKKEVYEKKLFGLGTPHPLADDFIGDYQAIAIDDYQLLPKVYKRQMKSAHAGILEDEMTIPLIFIHK